MATYVLVHGSAHGGWCYQDLARLLRAEGHDVYTPTLTGLGERGHLLSADVDLELHVPTSPTSSSTRTSTTSSSSATATGAW